MRAFGSAQPLSRAELLAAPVRWPRPSRLREPLELPAGKMADGMRSLGLLTAGALLEHLPRDSREARTVAALRPGEQATVAVQVRTISARPVRRRRMRPLVQANVFDATGSIRATFFNQPWLVERYPPGTRLLLHGKADAQGGFRVSHHAVGVVLGRAPQGGAGDGSDPAQLSCEPLAEGEPGAVAHYPASDGITSTQILTIVQGARERLCDVAESLPAATRVAEQLPDRASALAAMHFPRDGDDSEQARTRLAFEELLMAQLVFLRRRARRSARDDATALVEQPSLSGRWLAGGLPFAPTGDQRTAMEEIERDLSRRRAMQRLLMGEVGSGKTVVALYAMLRAIEQGHQAALMAPTETLAEQHFATLQRLIAAEPVATALLTGSTPARRRADIVGKLASGELSLVVGTHALIEPDVHFRSLVVAVVDEQHRFGVRQRAALDGKGAPHTLHMTATPIPRTLALASYGDLDTSTLRELPRGRQPIDTRAVAGERGRAPRLRRSCASTCAPAARPTSSARLIDEAEPDASRGSRRFRRRRGRCCAPPPPSSRGCARASLQGYELVLLHGGMRARARTAGDGARSCRGDVDVLVATTVIEVGYRRAQRDGHARRERRALRHLPAASAARARRPRASIRRSCRLIGPARIGEAARDGRARRRLRAGRDRPRLRSEGELVGTRQSGLRQFRVARLPEDAPLLELRARAAPSRSSRPIRS